MTSSQMPSSWPAPYGIPLEWGLAAQPYPGEVQSGDLHVVAPFAGGVVLGAIDGLGHGVEAAAAARLAAEVITAHAAADVEEQVLGCHEALRGTRGAALLVVSLSAELGRLRWVGVGNIEGWRLRWADGRPAREALICAAGVVGYQLPRLRARETDLLPDDAVVLATDGVRPEFVIDVAAQGGGATMESVANMVLDRHGRGNDDALVLAARYLRGAS